LANNKIKLRRIVQGISTLIKNQQSHENQYIQNNKTNQKQELVCHGAAKLCSKKVSDSLLAARETTM